MGAAADTANGGQRITWRARLSIQADVRLRISRPLADAHARSAFRDTAQGCAKYAAAAGKELPVR
jgi:hypothetical protein